MKHGKKELTTPQQAWDIATIIYRMSLKMPKGFGNSVLHSNASQKKFIKGVMSLYYKFQKIEMLINFYQEVYGKDVSFIRDMQFPEKQGMSAYMLILSCMTEDDYIEGAEKYFGVSSQKYQSPITENINHAEQDRIQPRPSGNYIFAYTGLTEVDTNHLGKSYDDMVNSGVKFATIKEYCAMETFHKFSTGEWMSVKDRTITATLWSFGSVVVGRSSYFIWAGCAPTKHEPDSGPREIVLD